MIKIKLLPKESVDIYSDFYSTISTFPLKLSNEYLQRCDVVRIFEINGKIVGGYVINSSTPLRFTDSVDDPEKYMDVFNNGIELAALSMTKKSSLFRVFYYYVMMLDCVFSLKKSNKKWVLGCTTVKKLRDFNKNGLPHDLFIGQVNGQQYFVFYGSSYEMLKGLVTGIPEAIKIPKILAKLKKSR